MWKISNIPIHFIYSDCFPKITASISFERFQFRMNVCMLINRFHLPQNLQKRWFFVQNHMKSHCSKYWRWTYWISTTTITATVSKPSPTPTTTIKNWIITTNIVETMICNFAMWQSIWLSFPFGAFNIRLFWQNMILLKCLYWAHHHRHRGVYRRA